MSVFKGAAVAICTPFLANGDVDYDKFRIINCLSDKCKQRCTEVTCKDTNDERNKTAHFFTVSRAEHCNGKSNKTAGKTDVNASAFCA